MLIKEMPQNEKPREKAMLYGVRSLSTPELVAILLRTGVKGQSALTAANKLLCAAGGVSGLARMSIRELMENEGVGEVKALELQTAFELSRRIAFEDVYKEQIATPESLVKWLQKEIGSAVQEKFLVVYLDQQHRIIRHSTLFQGTVNQSAVYPREVFREALLCSSTDIMLVHNHPSGNITPSDADIIMTERIWKIGVLMGINVLDHIIVSDKTFFSFARHGILEEFMVSEGNQW